MDPLIIPIAALAIPIIVAPTAMAFKHAAKLRDLEHVEKMRALELGRFNPGDGEWTTNGRIGAGIGAGVPIVSMIAAMVTTLEAGFHEEIWMATAMVGVAGVICGTLLVGLSRSAAAKDQSDAKPVYEPDAFDVVGTRG
ncbi:MAG TPA: hypothetical protein VGH33_23780 [Isosphaeraceae bacterium]